MCLFVCMCACVCVSSHAHASVRVCVRIRVPVRARLGSWNIFTFATTYPSVTCFPLYSNKSSRVAWCAVFMHDREAMEWYDTWSSKSQTLQQQPPMTDTLWHTGWNDSVVWTKSVQQDATSLCDTLGYMSQSFTTGVCNNIQQECDTLGDMIDWVIGLTEWYDWLVCNTFMIQWKTATQWVIWVSGIQ